jgi:predicted GIY-YIG superfamily endonuclease
MAVSQGRTALYRLLDDASALLYVGIAANPDVRLGQHSQTKSWWGDVAERKFEWFDTRSEALTAEGAAITSERPIWNSKLSAGRPTNTDAEALFEEHRQALEASRLLLPLVKAAAVEEMRVGRTVGQMARLTGLTDEVFRRLTRDNGIERRREPTVGKDAPKRD